MATAMMSLLEVLKGASEFLGKQGVESPRLNAEHLLAHVLGLKRMDLYLQFDRPLGETERAPLRDLIRRRGTGIPLQHLLGSVEFCGRTFKSDARALIPRPETEQLVERALRYTSLNSILDVATGSGVIPLTLALERPDAMINATDISSDALTLARENAVLLGVDRIVFHEADLIPESLRQHSFDLITANLPYIPSAEISTLSREVQHDPQLALDGGADGLDLVRRLAPLAYECLTPGGHLLLEIGIDQSDEVMTCLAGHNYRDITALPDYQGILRFIEAMKGN
ncbi:MAG: peptide chain release factor N(5)-glutamine methyltransferase [Chthoniobacterales bacterium]|nr:peptide chain release factor N(5)-glutamine methyltransferase [Chthoniobacterales bacterium]